MPKVTLIDYLALEPYMGLGVHLGDGAASSSVEKRVMNGETVAVKHFKGSYGSVFKRERLVLEKLDHAHVIKLLAYTEGINTLVLELAENGDLKKYLLTHVAAQRDPVFCKKVACEVAKGLVYLHKTARVVHNDIKPANIFLTAKGAKIGDFSTSQEITTGQTTYQTYVPKGTIRWWAPEHTSPSSGGGLLTPSSYRIGFRADIFAFGLVLWTMSTLDQSQPYDEINDNDIIEDEIYRGNFPKIPNTTSEHMRLLILWCMAYDAEKRPDAELVALALEDEQRVFRVDNWQEIQKNTHCRKPLLVSFDTPSSQHSSAPNEALVKINKKDSCCTVS